MDKRIEHVDFTQQSPTIISFCPGIRGLERGLERVFHSVRTAVFVEVETFIVENLLTAMEAGLVGPAPIWTNLKTFRPEPFRGRIDGIIGGYPCQPFSLAGNRGGEDDPRHLWPFIRRNIEVIQPGWCFFENVAGHLTLGFDVVKRELEEMGYFVEAGLYTAQEIGAPHKRERLFILAVRVGAAPSVAHTYNHDSGRIAGHVLPAEGEGTSEEDKREWNWDEHSPCSKAVGNTQSEHQQHDWQHQQSRSQPDRGSGAEMAYTNGGRSEQSDQNIRGLQKSDQGNSELADSSSPRNSFGLSGQEQRHEGPARIFNDSSPEHRFPAGQGIYQHEWEEPRTIESCVEYTIDGYNFTEDLHRAIGNSVVEQTAELAFRDLFRKMHGWFRYVGG